MAGTKANISNFSHLAVHDEQLARLGALAEHYFSADPNTCLLKLRQLGELLAQDIASRFGQFNSMEEKQVDLLRRLETRGAITRDVADLFARIRITGNDANHKLHGDHATALSTLKFSWQLSIWFHRTFGNPAFKSGPFIPPRAPEDESDALRSELERLRIEAAQVREAHNQSSAQVHALEAQLQQAESDRSVWEQLATEAETSNASLTQKYTGLQRDANAAPAAQVRELVVSASTAAKKIQLDEFETRQIIDQQLRAVGWEADTEQLSFRRGVRPQPNRYLAIAEWPTASGPADYALFDGMRLMAVIEAKRETKSAAGAIDQAKRYSRHVAPVEGVQSAGQWGDYRVPFAFSTNGRPYLEQLKDASGIWFCDLRSGEPARALAGWYSPQGLRDLYRQNKVQAEAQLDNLGFEFGFDLRGYQRKAIEAVEAAIKDDQRAALVAMATGTGKTKTCIGLVYRLLKAGRFRRILFLVDRSALGEQAEDAFNETRVDTVQTFADTFGIKGVDETAPDPATRVHIATVQGMARRVLNPSTDDSPPVDTYDCIVVDECHRGYLLDREMSDTELLFRDQGEYISVYRRVLDYFDAVKVGLTATPALHTTQIFGDPVFVYTYREAVLDGVLVDHEPPILIRTELSQAGIHYKAGEKVEVFTPETTQIDLFHTPDDLAFDVADFNRKIITESFNKVVVQALGERIQPFGPEKTLVFCVNDFHAQMVCRLFQEEYAHRYPGEFRDDMVAKITGSIDQPLKAIRRYKNDAWPTIAVTVDLLTTGIDVLPIVNLVFLRMVSSRILFEQMKGRATRRFDAIGKEAFRIYDAVGVCERMLHVSTMEPVVTNPALTFAQLAHELQATHITEAEQLIREQFVAKLQRRARGLSEEQRQVFRDRVGQSAAEVATAMHHWSPERLREWLQANDWVAEWLDAVRSGKGNRLVISTHADALISVEPGYGSADDYLQSFTEWVRSHSNAVPAITAVLTRPRELTRTALKDLAVRLQIDGFEERALADAWKRKTNRDIAASILGFVRQAALGDPLVPFDQRVDDALATMRTRHKLTPIQAQWLDRLGKQLKANIVLDRDTIEQGALSAQGGFRRIDRDFEGRLTEVLAELNEAVWSPPGGQAA